MKRSRLLTARLRERVVVTLKSGQSFSGVLYSHDDKVLVLRDTAALEAADDKSNVPVDGELLVLWPDVAWIQKP